MVSWFFHQETLFSRLRLVLEASVCSVVVSSIFVSSVNILASLSTPPPPSPSSLYLNPWFSKERSGIVFLSETPQKTQTGTADRWTFHQKLEAFANLFVFMSQCSKETSLLLAVIVTYQTLPTVSDLYDLPFCVKKLIYKVIMVLAGGKCFCKSQVLNEGKSDDVFIKRGACDDRTWEKHG